MPRVQLVVMACLLLACPQPPSSVATPVPPATQHAPDLVVAAPTRADPTLGPPQVWADVEVPFDSHAVVVWPVYQDSAVVLFANEAQAIQDRVAQQLATKGYSVLPPDKLRAIERAGAAGRLPLEQNQRCRAPLSRTEVLSRYFASFPKAFPQAECFRDCRLRVYVRGTAPEDSATFETTRIHVARPSAWLRPALRQVEDTVRGGVTGGINNVTGRLAVHFNALHSTGPWAKAPPSATMSHAERGAQACAHPDPRVGMFWVIRGAVDSAGRVSGCEAQSDSTLARAEDGRCLCTLTRTMKFPSGRRGRRFWISAQDQGGSKPGLFRMVQPGTQAWVRRLDESSAHEACLNGSFAPEGFDATAALKLDPDGTVQDVELYGNFLSAPSQEFATCLIRELRYVLLPCRPPGIDEFRVRIVADR